MSRTHRERPSKVVYAQMGGLTVRNDSSCCAERRLLALWRELARVKGVPSHRVTLWIRRKTSGGRITVWRRLCDGTLACAFPCSLCRMALERGLAPCRVTCSADGVWYQGRLDEMRT